MRIPIGELLVRQGTITREQCEQVLERQRITHRPFGEITEDMFGVDARAIEGAWAEQYADTTRWVNPIAEPPEEAVRDLVSRRQAWQFRILPMGYDQSELMVCTTKEGLVRAMNFVSRQIPVMCYFVLTKPEHLADALMRYYPIDGMNMSEIAAPMPPRKNVLRRAV